MSSCLRLGVAQRAGPGCWEALWPEKPSQAEAGGVLKRNVVMSDADWIYGAAHTGLAFLRGLHMGTKTSAGPSVARLGLNKSLLITGRPQPEPQPE